MAQRYKDEAGNIWAMGPDGKPQLVTPHSPLASPTLPYQAPQAQADLTGKSISNTKEQATLPYDVQKAAADAKTSQIAAKTAQEQWDISHPQLSGTANLTGPQYLQYLEKTNPGRGAYVQALSEGRVPFPGAMMMKTPAGQALLMDVMRADPTIDATNYSTRAAARKSAATGTLSQSDNALVTAVGHAARLESLVPDVFGTSATPVNSIANWADSHLFGGKQPAYDQNAQLLGDEVASAYGTNSQGKQNEAGAQFSSSLSTKQKQDNILGAIDLMSSKLAANRAQFAYGNGQLAKPDFMLLPAETQQELLSIPGAGPIVAKHFAGVPIMGGGNVGGGNPPPPAPPSLGGGNTPPPSGGGNPPVTPVDYSDTPSGPSIGPAAMDPNSPYGVFKQTYRNVTDPTVSAGLAALAHQKGSTYADATKFLSSAGYGNPGFTQQDWDKYTAYAQQHPNYNNATVLKSVPTTLGERVASSPGGSFGAAAAGAGTAGLMDVAGRAIDGPQWDANRQALSAINPKADLFGNVAGQVGGMFGGSRLLGSALTAGAKGSIGRDAVAWALKNPIKAGAAGDAAYNGVYGASENPDNPLAGAALGAGVGGATGLGAPVLSNIVGGGVRGVVNPAAERLQQAGIPLTVGEVLGGGFKKAQDAMTSIFGPGNMVERRYADGRQAFNQAAFNQAGAPINAKIFGTGQQGIQALDAAKSDAYNQALNPVSLNLNTPQFVNGMGGALQSAAEIPQGELPQGFATNAINRFVGNRIADDGTMSGPAFQQAYRGLAMTANRAAPKVEGHDIGQALGQAKDTLAGTLQEQNPDAYQGFLNANTANRNLNVLSNAVNAAKNQDGQMFTPAQLGMAATNNAKSFTGNIAAAAGQRPFNQLATDAQKVMSSRLPDSGTATRALVSGDLLTSGGILGGLAGLGGATGYQEGGAGGMFGGAIAPLGLLTLLGTRGGQKLLVRGLMNRPAAAQNVGGFVLNNPALMGQIGAGFTVPMLPRQ